MERTRLYTSLAIAGLLLFTGLLVSAPTLAQEDASNSVLSLSAEEAERLQLPDAMHAFLMDRTYEAIERRETAFEEIKTPEQVREYQERMQAHFWEQLGPMPERTPLNPHVLGTVQRDGYTVERIAFASQPEHFVTALFYLPEGEGPFPGVLFPCGHSLEGKGAESYQLASSLLAINGLAVLCYDPIEQGERMQLFDESGKYRVWGTQAHCRMGLGSILLGRNTASFRVWDGLRAMDYLASRPEVDATRLGCTGNSGGGTMTSFLMALDDRIDVAAPSCYLTSYQRLLETIGTQDAEQHFYNQLGGGFDHAEFIICRAPKPTLMCTATRDFFDIDGAWYTFRQAKRIYGRLDFAERVDLIETDQTHGFSTQLRVGAVRWMRRWLLGIDDAITEPEIELLSPEEYTCIPGGQVALKGSRTTYDLNVRFLEARREARDAAWSTMDAEARREAVRDVTGIRPLDELPAPTVEVLHSIEIDSSELQCTAQKILFQPDASFGIPMPSLLLTPKNPNGRICLYLHDQGRRAEVGPDGAVWDLAAEGTTVLAVDVRGIGDSKNTESSSYASFLGSEWKETTQAYVLGMSYLAMRSEDIVICGRWLQEEFDSESDIEIVAVGRLAPPALHAAALEPELFAVPTIQDGLESWESLIADPWATDRFVNTVHGALTVYDLPDLAELTGE